MKNQDIFIVGTAYSGSTLLGLALNSHSEIAYIGETSRIRKLDNIYHIANYPILNCFYCRINNLKCPLWNEKNEKDIELNKIFPLARKVLKKPVIIDGSKLIQWISLFNSKKLLDPGTKVIILVKNVFSYSNSASNREKFKPWMASTIWRDTYFDSIRFISRNNIPNIVVRYEDFALEPKKVLIKICRFLDLDFESQMLEFYKFPAHAIGGNLSAYCWFDNYEESVKNMDPANKFKQYGKAYKKKQFGGWVDTKWMDSLRPEEVASIVQSPGVVDISNLMGYSVTNLINQYYKHNQLKKI